MFDILPTPGELNHDQESVDRQDISFYLDNRFVYQYSC